MDELERRFKINREGNLKNQLGVYCKWGVRDNGKTFCEATMTNKVKVTVE